MARNRETTAQPDDDAPVVNLAATRQRVPRVTRTVTVVTVDSPSLSPMSVDGGHGPAMPTSTTVAVPTAHVIGYVDRVVVAPVDAPTLAHHLPHNRRADVVIRGGRKYHAANLRPHTMQTGTRTVAVTVDGFTHLELGTVWLNTRDAYGRRESMPWCCSTRVPEADAASLNDWRPDGDNDYVIEQAFSAPVKRRPRGFSLRPFKVR